MPPPYSRRDDWIQDAMGNAQSGAGVYVTSQPSTPGYINQLGAYVPPSPLVQLYADAGGVTQITQPVVTDGYGHAAYYTSTGTYTVTYNSPYIGQVTLPDQAIVSALAPVITVNQTIPAGTLDGSNRHFTIPTVATSYLLLFVNGIFQRPAYDYVLNAMDINMVIAPHVGDQLFAVYQ